MAISLFSRKKSDGSDPDVSVRTPRRVDPPTPSPDSLLADYQPSLANTFDPDPLVRMFQQKRYSLIVKNREQFAEHPKGKRLIEQAGEALEMSLALVPQGLASLANTLTDQPDSPQTDVEVAPFYIAMLDVTNSDFQLFVDDKGYENMDLWPEEILPYLIEFHDLTGAPAPRYWRDGRHDVRRADHPVVGVSWYEASAYAAWVGMRLPTEPEWQMAASWRVKSTADILRRFPWGDALECTRCNLWNSGVGTTVSVDEYPTGAAPNSALQLIGNVWEWVATEFNIQADDQSPIVGEMPMMGVRGGGFDTYFESQASSTFRSGQISLGRTHNTGFRLALDLHDMPLSAD